MLKQFCRFFHAGSILNGKSLTRPTGIVPGSIESKEPLRWAKRLFDLKENKNNSKVDEVSKLHLVILLKKPKGCNYFLKSLFEKYGLLYGKVNDFVIVKNSDSVNKDLIHLIHFIKVVPVTFPNGVPKSENDFLSSKIHPDGRIMVHKGLNSEEDIVPENEKLDNETAKELIYQPTEFSKRSLKFNDYKKQNINQWCSTNFMNYHFTPLFQYTHNEDGKEYRYSKLWKHKEALKQSKERRFNKDGTYRINDNAEADWNTFPWRFY